MLAEKIIFAIFATYLLIAMFFKFIKKLDKTYIAVLVMQALSLLLEILEVIFDLKYNIFIKVIMYLISVIIPVLILLLEKKGKHFTELIYKILTKIYEITGNSKKNKELWLKLIDKYPNNYLAHVKLAEIYEKEGGMRKAIDEYVKAVDLNKKDYDSYYKISFLLNELGKRDDASVMLKNLLEKKPDYIKASMLLGDILCAQERYKEALNIYNKGLKHTPNSFELYYSLGIVYTMLNDFENAKICYEKASTINNLLTHAYYALGQINLVEMDLDEAERYFTKALEDKEQEPDAYYKLGKIYMLRGDHENAVNFVNLAIELDNNYIKIANHEPIFIPIKSKFKMPIIDEEDIHKKKSSHTEKEKKAIKHLDETYGVVGKLNMHKLKPRMRPEERTIEDEREKF